MGYEKHCKCDQCGSQINLDLETVDEGHFPDKTFCNYQCLYTYAINKLFGTCYCGGEICPTCNDCGEEFSS